MYQAHFFYNSILLCDKMKLDFKKMPFFLPLWLFDFRRYYEYGNVFENGLRSDRV